MINQVYCGDCLDIMSTMKPQSIDLIYLDPPFFTNKKHKLLEKNSNRELSFDDLWQSNIAYGEFLLKRIQLMKTLLKDTGSLFVHCDKTAEHIIRTILDHVFGSENFQSEIIWHYKRWSNAKKGLMPSHQNIYFYSRTTQFKFNTIYTSYSETTNIDQILQTRMRDEYNKTIYALDDNGQFKHGKEKKGVPLHDVWEIPYLNPKAKERTGYPTQKPLLLLERIIKLVTDKNDLILDPFCGSGTTCVAAKLLARNYIGIDISKEAVFLSQERLVAPVKTESCLLQKGRESFLTADTEALHLLTGIAFNPIHRNKGIDAILVEQFENTPVLIRVQKAHETLSEAMNYLFHAKQIKQAKLAILIQTHHNDLFDKIEPKEGIIILSSLSLQLANILKNGSSKVINTMVQSNLNLSILRL